MSEYATLTVTQFAELQQAAREREATILAFMLQVPDYPPLPACPSCGEHPQRTDSMVEDPAFEVYETVLLIRFKPCGHRFRTVVTP